MSDADLDRLWSHVDKSGDCWEWTGFITAQGYGTVRWEGKTRRAHRVTYALENGPIPAGLEIDHICRNRSCVNPDHLRAVSKAKNQYNRGGANINSKTGIRGVFLHKGRFVGQVRMNGESVYLGRFDTAEEAGVAVAAKRAEMNAERAAWTDEEFMKTVTIQIPEGPHDVLRRQASDEGTNVSSLVIRLLEARRDDAPWLCRRRACWNEPMVNSRYCAEHEAARATREGKP